MSQKFKDNFYWIIILILSLVLSIIVVFLNYIGIVTQGMELIPNLIMVASIVLGIITFNLTIIISIRDGNLYNWIKENKACLLSQLYGFAVAAIFSSAIVILLALLILTTKEIIANNNIYKYICIIVISAGFFNMVFDTAMSFIQNIQMLKLDDINDD